MYFCLQLTLNRRGHSNLGYLRFALLARSSRREKSSRRLSSALQVCSVRGPAVRRAAAQHRPTAPVKLHGEGEKGWLLGRQSR